MSEPLTVKRLQRADLSTLVTELRGAGEVVIAPARQTGGVGYQPVSSFEQVVLDVRPRNALKSFFLPPTEPLLRYHKRGQDVELEEISAEFSPRVVLGALPCDAAALPVVDRVMDWDYRDEPWFGRRAATTVISIACAHADDACFCTGVGLGPCHPQGADVMLVPQGEDFLAEVHSEKGQAFVERWAVLFQEPQGLEQAQAFRERARAALAHSAGLDPAAARRWIEAHFMDPHWARLALPCHGCGACAMVCPTCHCFDIVDEQEGVGGGTRRRNHDYCQYGLFTLHGAGHNPRADQGARIRQRVSHKFAIYPDRFDAILCTGCGRCSRACAAGIDMLEVVEGIAGLQSDIDEETPTGGAL
jgi:ferredoxin